MKVWLAWSSGKDSAWALHVVRRQRGGDARRGPDVDVVGLLTTVTGAYERVSMHGVREALLAKQAEATGLPLRPVVIPPGCANAQYEEAMDRAMAEAQAGGVEAVVFGDLFLADVRAYRERQLARAGMRALFPLWGRDTRELAREMIGGGLGARLTCIDPRLAPRELAGQLFDEELLERLPPGVDPCGENGEFHTFAFAGPMFSRPIAVEVGETVEREGFVFTDVIPAGPRARASRGCGGARAPRRREGSPSWPSTTSSSGTPRRAATSWVGPSTRPPSGCPKPTGCSTWPCPSCKRRARPSARR